MQGGLRRVGINALYLDPGVSGGTETYLRELVPELARQAPAVELEIATTRRGARSLVAEGWTDIARIHALPVDQGERIRHLVNEQARLPALAQRRRWDVLHSVANLAPIRPRVPAVVTLHDLLYLRHRTLSWVTTTAMRWTVIPAARRADALIAISQAARDDICAVTGFAPERFAVIPNGAGRQVATGAAAELDVRERYALGDARVVLCVGAKRPHKNQELLVRAAQQLPDDVLVVLAGHPESYDTHLRSLAGQLGVEGRVRFVDYVPDEDLEGLWRAAACAALPTLAEGFGLPLLEAFGHGVAVAASDIPVLREVGGDVPRWFDPSDPAAAAAAIRAAMADEGAGAAGAERVARFSWAENARAVLAVYERAASGARSASARS